jgi:hypothetical protein
MLTDDPAAIAYWFATFVFPTLAACLFFQWLDARMPK